MKRSVHKAIVLSREHYECETSTRFKCFCGHGELVIQCVHFFLSDLVI